MPQRHINNVSISSEEFESESESDHDQLAANNMLFFNEMQKPGINLENVLEILKYKRDELIQDYKVTLKNKMD